MEKSLNTIVDNDIDCDADDEYNAVYEYAPQKPSIMALKMMTANDRARYLSRKASHLAVIVPMMDEVLLTSTNQRGNINTAASGNVCVTP